MFRFGKPSEFRRMVAELLRELRLLLVRSDEAKLSERDNLVWLFGPEEKSVNEVLGMMELWSEQKELLYNAAEKVLAIGSPTKEHREAFVHQLRDFCEKTGAINTTWLRKVTDALTGVLLAEPSRLENSGNLKVFEPIVRRAAGVAASQD